VLGWYLDIILGYPIRLLLRAFRERNCLSWPTEKGTVIESACPAITYGGPVGEVTYTYTHQGEYYSGTHREPFFLSDSAEAYARRVESGSEIVIRVNPEKPELSLVRNNDQRKTHYVEPI
jgi:hypothetical protein